MQISNIIYLHYIFQYEFYLWKILHFLLLGSIPRDLVDAQIGVSSVGQSYSS